MRSIVRSISKTGGALLLCYTPRIDLHGDCCLTVRCCLTGDSALRSIVGRGTLGILEAGRVKGRSQYNSWMHAIGWKSDQSHRVENTLFDTESLKYWCNNGNSIM